SLIIFFKGLSFHFSLIKSGKKENNYKINLGKIISNFLSWVLLQSGIQKLRPTKREEELVWSHLFMFYGFLALLITTTAVFIHQDLGIKIYQGNTYLALTLLSDLFGGLFILGCLIAIYRRYVVKPDRLHSQSGDIYFLSILLLLLFQGFILEALRIKATNDPWALFSPVGYLFSLFFWPLSVSAAEKIHYIFWWFHTATVFAFIALIPYTKAFHLIASAVNAALVPPENKRKTIRSMPDLEELLSSEDSLEEEVSLGAESTSDLTWKQLLDLEACTSCGRCQDVCPAYKAHKPLSPKWLMLDLRNQAMLAHLNKESQNTSLLNKLNRSLVTYYLESTSGLDINLKDKKVSVKENGSFRGKNTEVQHNLKKLTFNPTSSIASELINEDTFWVCTSCRACVENCPVGINQLDIITEVRRGLALMQGKVPSEAQQTLRALELRGNPYGPAEDRTSWLEGLDAKILQDGETVDYLYWVGCVCSYDKRKQKIARALVKILNSANINFGILGTREKCTGDPARRLGEENLFQTLAKQNIDLLNKINYKYILTTCPHCYHIFKNEYPSVAKNNFNNKVIHHTQLIAKLIKDNKIKVKKDFFEKVTFHDPCYLGRYNNIFREPRQCLTAQGAELVEMNRSFEQSMCCGAGGGNYWMDIKIGERVNVIRTKEALETGAKTVATACPFCHQMMEDGVKILEKDLAVLDIAEIVAENIAV
ncbi:MAG: hypothetical protein D6780_04215, partial [Candidatus Dadabacteria bacterium]